MLSVTLRTLKPTRTTRYLTCSNNLICCKTGFNVDGKTSKIAFQLVLHDNIANLVACFFFPLVLSYLNVHSSTETRGRSGLGYKKRESGNNLTKLMTSNDLL